MFPESITRDEINQLELRAYNGEVEIITTRKESAAATRELKKQFFVGFDTESRPSFKKGQINPIALIQMAIPAKVFLFRINHTGVPQNLIDIFTAGEIRKIGVSIHDDLKALKRLKKFTPKAFIDLNKVARAMDISSQGLRKLTALILGFRISKSQQTSNWEKKELDQKQVIYAATDAWCCYKIYERLIAKGHID